MRNEDETSSNQDNKTTSYIGNNNQDVIASGQDTGYQKELDDAANQGGSLNDILSDVAQLIDNEKFSILPDAQNVGEAPKSISPASSIGNNNSQDKGSGR